MVSEIRGTEQEQEQQQQPEQQAEAQEQAQPQEAVSAEPEVSTQPEEQAQLEPQPQLEPQAEPEPQAQPELQAQPVHLSPYVQEPAPAPQASPPPPAPQAPTAPRAQAPVSAPAASAIPSATKTDTIAPEVWVPDFGMFDLMYLEPERRYQGRIYRLTAEQVKTLSETIGFTARFEHPNIRDAYVDIVKTEGHICFELDRNTKPMELNLRYARDRWSVSDAGSKGADALRPWIRSAYDCRFLPEKVAQVVATQLRMDAEKVANFYIRLNFKDRTAGLIAEDKFIDVFPTQPFQVFALPEGHVAVVPTVEIEASEEGGKSRQQERVIIQEVGPKYATYSRSEVDRMMKMQADNITTTLSGKMSGQQRSFLEAVEAQERAFNKITERYVIQFEEARLKLESHTKSMHESAQTELDRLNQELTKELTEFRAHVNKNILPISRQIEEKVKEIQVAAARPAPKENLKSLILGVGGALLAAIIVSTAILCANVSQISELTELKTQLNKVLEKSNK